MSVTVDTNVLVYAANVDDPAHERAGALIEQLTTGNEILHLLWPTLLGYLRICTSPGLLRRPVAPAEALANIRDLVELPNSRVLGEGPGFVDHLESATGPGTRGRDVPDAHLVALMRQHGTRVIYTRDRGFRRFDGIQAVDPFA